MKRYYYDLHIHSALSPCADDDMTPNNIAGMAAIKGLQFVALTDHNSCANCPAFFEAAERMGIIPIAGMEMTTAEEIHMVCLFATLAQAAAFEQDFKPYRFPIKNRPEIFGNQLLMDGQDEVIGTDPYLLPPASGLDLQQAVQLVRQHGGVCHPAHIDRPSGGILAILGDIPPEPGFRWVEYADPAHNDGSRPQRALFCSDAHQLWAINEAEHAFEVPDEVTDADEARTWLFELLRGDKP